ncbi:hydrogenase maturation nickel metallochaperone HypA [Clostridium sp.]|uniref:hydrogenase maturation nickel metallochaperone HypA n=1 Tax=Clostridium sp. TaxID=1506 RepID=UPI003217E324
MHEASVATEICDIVLLACKENYIFKVFKVILELGEFSCIQEEQLQFAFEIIIENTIIEGASLNIERVPATGYCKGCDITFPITFTDKICPRCNLVSEIVSTGYETSVKSIEGD